MAVMPVVVGADGSEESMLATEWPHWGGTAAQGAAAHRVGGGSAAADARARHWSAHGSQ